MHASRWTTLLALLLWSAVSAHPARAQGAASTPSWTNTGGPAPNKVYAVLSLLVDPSIPDSVYAGTSSGGVYKTLDGGVAWSPLTAGLNALVYSIAVHPADPAIVYVADWWGGLYKSNDRGATWAALTNPSFGVRALAISPASPYTMYAGSGNGVHMSTDGGTSWTWLGSSSALGRVYALVVDPTSPLTVYVGSSKGVLKTTTGVAPFSTMNTGLTNIDVRSLVMDPATPATLYAGTAGGVFKTTNGGTEWAPAGAGQTAGTINALAVNPTTPTTLYAGGTTLYKSTDGGTTWSPASSGLPTGSAMSIALLPATPDTVYAGLSTGGIWKSVNGGSTWVAVSTGLAYTDVWSLAFDPHEATSLFAGAAGQIAEYNTATRVWEPRSGGFTGGTVWSLAFDPDTPGTAYAGSFCNGVFKTTDGGLTWAPANTGLTVLCVESLVVDYSNPTTVYASTNDGVFKSTDAAGSWTALPIPPSTSYDGRRDYQALAMDPVTPTTLYAGGTLPSAVYKTIDGGATWTPGTFPTTGEIYVNAVLVDPDDPATVYVAADAVYKSVDGGANWALAGLGGYDRYGVRALARAPGPVPALLAAKGRGVYSSRDGGATWTNYADGFPNVRVHSLAYGVTNGALYAGTLGRGVFALAGPAITSVSPSLGPPAGGTTVTVTGTGFMPGATLWFDGVAATGVTVVSDTTITGTTPAHAAGAVAVHVQNPTGQTGVLAGGFTYQPLLQPNLRVATIKAPTSAASGSSFSLTDTTKNDGPGSADASHTAIWLSTNKTLGGDTQLATRAVPSLAAGAVSTKATPVTLPTVAPGVYYLIVQADTDGEVAETSETDNLKVKTLTVGPDLLAATMTFVPPVPTHLTPTTITVATKNNGADTAGPSVTRVYRSADTKIGAGDILLGEWPVLALAPKGTQSNSVTVTLPAGTYYVIAQVDATNAVVEAKETNNLKKVKKTVS